MISTKTIVTCVSNMTLIPYDTLMGDNRFKYITRARFAICLMAHEQGKSYSQIGKELNGRDHTTIMHSVHRAKDLEEGDVGFRLLMQQLRRELSAFPQVAKAMPAEVKKIVDQIPQRSDKPKDMPAWDKTDRVAIRRLERGSDNLARAINQARGAGACS